MGTVLLVAIATGLAYLWGLSWATGDFPECGSGTYFLADFGWLMGGLLLGLIVGIVLTLILVRRLKILLVIPLVVAAGVGMLVAGDAGAAQAARQVGCDVWHVNGAGEMVVMGFALGAVPTTTVVAIAVGIGWLFRPHPRS